MKYHFLLGVLPLHNYSTLQGYLSKEVEQACASERGIDGPSNQLDVFSIEWEWLQTWS
jgi:hypothetical protein